MALEIERKFLVQGDGWKNIMAVPMMQAYVFNENGASLRVRLCGKHAFLTLKAKTDDNRVRKEFEYDIPVEDALAMMPLCKGYPVEKIRYTVVFNKRYTWEIDEFIGVNKGLVVAEIELRSANEEFETPPWLGKEVTDDPRYLNANLAINPYSDWK